MELLYCTIAQTIVYNCIYERNCTAIFQLGSHALFSINYIQLMRIVNCLIV